MMLDKIYKTDASGNTRIWYAEVGEGNDIGYWRTHSGVLFGAEVVSEWRYAEPKSQADAHEQAIFEAQAAMTKKLKLDYKLELDKINEIRYSYIKPMLAHEYMGWQGPCFAQPKLDGMRCLANKDGLWTRGNGKIISTPHIEGRLKNFFIEYPNIVLDGELYNHELHDNFNLIISLSKKTKPSFLDLEMSEKYIQYWVYDMYDLNNPQNKFKERYSFIENKVPLNFHIAHVVTNRINTEEELDIYYEKLLENGFEGQIVRFNAPYEEKRSRMLLKRKSLIDEEFELVDILEGEGNWSGLAKKTICALPDGRTFGTGVTGTKEFCERLLHEKSKYKTATVKYLNLTPDRKPRGGSAIKFYEEEFGALKEYIKPEKDLFG